MSGSRPAQMSAMATASPSARTSANCVEHRRRPMEGERLVDGPDAAPGLALAHGREGLADGRRMVAVVVVDDDAGASPLRSSRRPTPGNVARPRGDLRRGDAEDEAAPTTASAFAALCRPAVESRVVDRPGQRVEPVEFHGRRRRGRWRSPGRTGAVAGRRPSRTARRSPARSRRAVAAPGRPGRRRRPCPASRRRRSSDRRDAASPSWRRPSPPAGAARSQASKASTTAAGRRRRRGDPIRRWSGPRRRVVRRRSCPRTRRPRRRSASPPPQRAVAGGPPVIEAGSRAPTKADGSARLHEDVDQPARGRALAVRAGDADERPPGRGVGDDLLPRLDGDPGVARRAELGLVRVDGGERLGHGQAVRRRGAGHVRRQSARARRRSRGLERRRVRRRAARVAAA